MGAEPIGSPELEVRVAEGHEGCMGRLDILQATNAGNVIFETQYGTSDSQHRERFDGYANSVKAPLAIVWAAESFRAKDIKAVQFNTIPVLCVEIRGEKHASLHPLHAIKTALGSLEERIKRETFRLKLAKAYQKEAFKRAEEAECERKRSWAAGRFLARIQDKRNVKRQADESFGLISSLRLMAIEQAKEDCICKAKDKAKHALKDWSAETISYEKAKSVYEELEHMCVMHGCPIVLDVPFVGNFLDGYSMGGQPEGFDALDNLMDHRVFNEVANRLNIIVTDRDAFNPWKSFVYAA